jgi:ribonuclease-3
MAAPNIENQAGAEQPRDAGDASNTSNTSMPSTTSDTGLTGSEDEFDLSDISHQPAEMSREDIIAAAEAAAYSE